MTAWKCPQCSKEITEQDPQLRAVAVRVHENSHNLAPARSGKRPSGRRGVGEWIEDAAESVIDGIAGIFRD